MSESNKNTMGMIGILFATVALVFGAYANFSCDSVMFPVIGGDSPGSAILTGMWGYRTTEITGISTDVNGSPAVWYRNVCTPYDALDDETFQYETDDRTRMLQAVAISIAVIGTIGLFLSCLASCACYFGACGWKLVNAIFLMCCVLQGCSLLLIDSTICTYNPVIQYMEDTTPLIFKSLQNPYQCERTYGYNLNIASVVFWFCATVLTCCASVPSTPSSPQTSSSSNNNNNNKKVTLSPPHDMAWSTKDLEENK